MTGRSRAAGIGAALVASLVLAGGCGGNTSEDAPSGKDSATKIKTVAQKTPDARSAAAVGALVSTPWELTDPNAEPTDGGTTIKLTATAGGCFTYVKTVVDEQEDSVLIASLAKDTRTQPDESCPLNQSLVREAVTLKDPLGGRPLIHAPISEAWSKVAG